MAEFELFGDADNDPGQWFDFGKKKPFRIKIRRVPVDKARDFEKRHEGKDQFEVIAGLRRRVRDIQNVLQTHEDIALWAWTDLDGLTLTARDKESAKWLGCAVGETVTATGAKLTNQLKRALAEKVKPLAVVDREVEGKTEEVRLGLYDFIAEKVNEMNQAQAAAEEELAGN